MKLPNKIIQGNSTVDDHLRICAARNKKTALVLGLFSAYEVLICWRNLNKPITPEKPTLLLVFAGIYCLVLLALWMASLKCFRERLVLTLGMTSFTKTIVVLLLPGFAEQYTAALREFSLVLWLVIFLISLSLLKSALNQSALE